MDTACFAILYLFCMSYYLSVWQKERWQKTLKIAPGTRPFRRALQKYDELGTWCTKWSSVHTLYILISAALLVLLPFSILVCVMQISRYWP